MRPCLDDEETFALVDGAVAEKDAAILRRHIDGCERCRTRVRAMERTIFALAEEENVDPVVHADAVLAALDEADVITARATPRRFGRILPLAIGGLAAAAALFIGIGLRRNTADDGFTARGGAMVDAPLRRSLAVTVQVLDGNVPRALTNEATVTPKTRFVASHRNTGTTTGHALVFAVDAKRSVHWLYPAYESAGTDPSSVMLAPTEGREVLMGTGVAFEDLAAGPASIVTVLSREPVPVSRIEQLSDPSPGAIQAALPGAEVTSIRVEVTDR
jgi:hypothetical protein